MENDRHQSSEQNRCKICNKKFINFTYVQEHFEAVHEKIKRYFCDICNYKVYYEWQFRRHLKSKHDQELNTDLKKFRISQLNVMYVRLKFLPKTWS